ncbi:MAG: ribosome recycling factor [Anaerolineae bacterium]|nr:ribosome recycling factor [Thermoflexales bacterium]MDW8408203.1 ribosome recycling factor [Anaerolineae bacterium]
MADSIKQVHADCEKAMQKSIDAMEVDFQAIRTGRASSHLLDRVMVEYHGASVSLQQLASVSVPEPQTILIRPYDPSSLKSIERAILASDLKLTPNNDGKVVRLTIPPLTQERRKELAKMVSRRVEEAKVSLRNHRREAMERLKKLEDDDVISEDEHKRAQKDIENLMHKFSARADELGKHKESEILEL